MRVEDVLRASPPGFPPDATVPPSDFTRYAPTGNGVDVGHLPIMPWSGDPAGSPGYKLYDHVWDPLLGAPITEPSGGVLYFGHRVRRADFDAVLRVLAVGGHLTKYLAFVQRTSEVGRRGFATQVRIVRDFALELFGSRAGVPAQPLTIADAMWRSMELERETDLSQTLGGDGDWASEELGVGLLVENEYRGVYRIWSRPWLRTK